MAKDPAFLFYSQDFVTGTMFMTNEQVGIYVRLLIAQHQHGGIIEKSVFTVMVGNHEIVKSKFIETEDGFFNERLMKEIVKRSKKSTNLSVNAKKRWDIQKEKSAELLKKFQEDANAMQLHSKSISIASGRHMPIENENESVLSGKGGMGEKPEDPEQDCFNSLITDIDWIQGIATQYKVGAEQVTKYLEEFKLHRFTDKQIFNGRRDYITHFKNWLRKKDSNPSESGKRKMVW